MSADGHEDRRLDLAVGSGDDPGTGTTVLVDMGEFEFKVLVNRLIGLHRFLRSFQGFAPSGGPRRVDKVGVQLTRLATLWGVKPSIFILTSSADKEA